MFSATKATYKEDETYLSCLNNVSDSLFENFPKNCKSNMLIVTYLIVPTPTFSLSQLTINITEKALKI